MTEVDVYRQLNKMYSSPLNDTIAEMNQAQIELRYALDTGTTPEIMYAKMRELLASSDGLYKAKLSTVVLNRFWDKTFLEPIPFRQLKA